MHHRLAVLAVAAVTLSGGAGAAYALTSQGPEQPAAHTAAGDLTRPSASPSATSSASPNVRPKPSPSPTLTPVTKPTAASSPTAKPAAPPAPESAPKPAPKPAAQPAPKPAPKPVPKPVPRPPASGIDYNAAANSVLAQLNTARAKSGVAPLTMDTRLIGTARAHNARMAGGCGLAHECPGEGDIGRLWDAGVTDNAIGENIGYGHASATTSAVTAMARLLTSDMLAEKPPEDGHRVNILNAGFQHVGIAIVRDASGRVWLTQDFSGTSLPKG